ncbi:MULTISPECIES: proline dehydrogenase family protein [unclassified Methanoculleus]|uniref:proline dehydrogenase family protein n=1 Tax=unclassified Methanoculleus TaxID=2619537 RepID=UPI0025CEA626|nr:MULTISPECIES: proline dehydrogenase family protein [unclassified Methanoculleus]
MIAPSTSGRVEHWTLPDLDAAVRRCRAQNARGIRCILAALGEYARSEQQVRENLEHSSAAIAAIKEQGLDASLTVKMTALGVLLDRDAARESLIRLCSGAHARGIGFEVDMEGRGLVGTTVDAAVACARQGLPVTLALQTSLDRTAGDLERIVRHGIRPRLVKGAYRADTDDPGEVRERFRTLAAELLDRGVPFSAGTHDPDLVAWLVERAGGTVEFGFLMGLADETKLRLAKEGRAVAEYVPFGDQAKIYVARREAYLAGLAAAGRAPVP